MERRRVEVERFFFQAEDGIRDGTVTGVQTCALPILPVGPGESLSAEPVMVASGSDYHAQLENYGEAIRTLHHARVSAPTPIGWWSWTAYYFGLTQGTALTNAQWLAQNLKQLGYTYFH